MLLIIKLYPSIGNSMNFLVFRLNNDISNLLSIGNPNLKNSPRF